MVKMFLMGFCAIVLSAGSLHSSESAAKQVGFSDFRRRFDPGRPVYKLKVDFEPANVDWKSLAKPNTFGVLLIENPSDEIIRFRNPLDSLALQITGSDGKILPYKKVSHPGQTNSSGPLPPYSPFQLEKILDSKGSEINFRTETGMIEIPAKEKFSFFLSPRPDRFGETIAQLTTGAKSAPDALAEKGPGTQTPAMKIFIFLIDPTQETETRALISEPFPLIEQK